MVSMKNSYNLSTDDGTTLCKLLAQTKDIQHIVESYIMDNPEILAKASEAYKNKQMTQMKSKANAYIQSHKADFLVIKRVLL